MYAEGSVPGSFDRMEINHLPLPLPQWCYMYTFGIAKC